jgi:hypothetical protein
MFPDIIFRFIEYLCSSDLHVFVIELMRFTLNYLTSRVLLEKLTVILAVKIFLRLYGTRIFVTVFTRALHWLLF